MICPQRKLGICALEIAPRNSAAHHLLGLTAALRRQYPLAISRITKAIDYNPNVPKYHADLAIAYRMVGQAARAIQAGRRRLALEPDVAEAHDALADLLNAGGDPVGAEQSYRAALAIDPSSTTVHNSLGDLLLGQQKYDAAATAYQSALAQAPGDAAAQNGLGIVLQLQGDLPAAITCYQKTLAVDPRDVSALFNLGTIYQKLHRLGEAQSAFESCAALTGDNVDVLLHLGQCLEGQGRFVEAEACYEKCLLLEPHDKHAHWFRGALLLRQAEFARGWTDYEWQLHDAPRSSAPPHWDGSPADGKRILIRSCLQFADSIFFARYAALVATQGGQVTLEVPADVAKLLHLPSVSRVIAEGDDPQGHDWQVSLLSLPRLLGATVDPIPAVGPYLRAEPALVASWARRICTGPNLKVGVYCRTDEHPTISASEIPPAALNSLSRASGVTFYRLQTNAGFGETLASFDGALMDMAAIVQNMDLVIATDSVVAHLAARSACPSGCCFPTWPTGAGLPLGTTAPGIRPCGCFASLRPATGRNRSSRWHVN